MMCHLVFVADNGANQLLTYSYLSCSAWMAQVIGYIGHMYAFFQTLRMRSNLYQLHMDCQEVHITFSQGTMMTSTSITKAMWIMLITTKGVLGTVSFLPPFPPGGRGTWFKLMLQVSWWLLVSAPSKWVGWYCLSLGEPHWRVL